jgi:alcohol dehydrogenase (NADP+)
LKSGKVARSELFITTKIWNDPSISALETLKNSLKDLNVDYVDLCLVHWSIGVPDAENKKILQKPLHLFWKEMEELVRLGLTR